MKLYTIFPRALKGSEWVVGEILGDIRKLLHVSTHKTFAEACKAERALRREAFSAVLKSKGKKK